MPELAPPAPQTSAGFHPATPIGKVSSYFAEHKRDQVHHFGWDSDCELRGFESPEKLLEFLGGYGTSLPLDPNASSITCQSFFAVFNSISGLIKKEHFPKSPLLLIKSTGEKIPPGHVIDTQSRPDFIAAFDEDFKGGTPSWPKIRLVGEDASKGKSRRNQSRQCMTYVHYLLLARPELYVAHGILTLDDGVDLMVGMGGYGVKRLNIAWKSSKLRKLLFAFIYRLYNPGDFVDPTCKFMGSNDKGGAMYTIEIAEREGVPVNCPDFLHVFTKHPFGTRTHFYSNPGSRVKVRGKEVTCIKEYWGRSGSRFEEYGILTDCIHNDGIVPGIVEAVGYSEVQLPHGRVDPEAPRVKRRHGMRQYGKPFMSIPNLGMMLKIVYDVLEVLRFLRMHRNVLHRDISKGNVMYTDLPQKHTEKDVSEEANRTMCFAERLLGNSERSLDTSLLLIDFNRAEHLETQATSGQPQIPRTGTPVFIARAVEKGAPIPPLPVLLYKLAYPAIPDSYAKRHRRRAERFPASADIPAPVLDPAPTLSWRHTLDHDVESVFWLMLYWSLLAQPKGGTTEDLKHATWSELIGDVGDRNVLLMRIAYHEGQPEVHSAFGPLRKLLRDLAVFLLIDRHYLPPGPEAHNDPDFLVEIFQRLILTFIEENAGASFMQLEIAIDKPRAVPQIPVTASRSSTTSQAAASSADSKGSAKRQSSEISTGQLSTKRFRPGPGLEGEMETEEASEI